MPTGAWHPPTQISYAVRLCSDSDSAALRYITRMLPSGCVYAAGFAPGLTCLHSISSTAIQATDTTCMGTHPLNSCMHSLPATSLNAATYSQIQPRNSSSASLTAAA